MYEHQGIRDSGAQAADVTGLPVTVPITDTRRLRDPRASVGSAMDVVHYLAVAMAALGERDFDNCGAAFRRAAHHWGFADCSSSEPSPAPENFLPNVYGSACNTCQGLGTLREPDVGNSSSARKSRSVQAPCTHLVSFLRATTENHSTAVMTNCRRLERCTVLTRSLRPGRT